MSNWIRLHNSIPHHPRIVEAGRSAAWLFVCGLCYSNEHLTDGFISWRSLGTTCPGFGRTDRAVVRLVQTDLWREVDGGWMIVDYTQYQRSAAEIRDSRERDRLRKQNFRPESERLATAESARIPRVEKRREDKKETSSPRAVEQRTDPQLGLCRLLAALILERDPGARVVPDGEAWLRDMRLLVADRGGDATEVERVLRWSQADSFWQANVLSPRKLREKFTQLVLKAGSSSAGKPAGQRAEEWEGLGLREGESLEAWRVRAGFRREAAG